MRRWAPRERFDEEASGSGMKPFGMRDQRQIGSLGGVGWPVLTGDDLGELSFEVRRADGTLSPSRLRGRTIWVAASLSRDRVPLRRGLGETARDL